MAKFTCPFCIRSYNMRQIPYVCPDCHMETKREFWQIGGPTKCGNPACARTASLRKCPFCQNTIPKATLETPILPFSIVGVSNSGKTNYITVMLHELSRSPGFRMALAHQNDATIEAYNKNYSSIFEEHTILGATERKSGEGDDEKPQIWMVRNLEQKTPTKVPSYTLTIFDGAGEDHEHELDPSSNVCRYIKASKAILLVIDPLVLPSIRRGGVVDEKVLLNSMAGDNNASQNSMRIINSVANYIKAARGIASSKLLDVPVAVVLTKFDTILNHPSFGPQAVIRKRSLTIKNGMLDLSEVHQVDAEIRNWIEKIGEAPFINTLDSHFKEYYFFGVSSYGAPPKDFYTLPDEIKPHRVLDPIMWLFKRFRFIN